MQLATVTRTIEGHESPAALAALDSTDTLVILFGPTGLLDDATLLTPLLEACPRSQIIGCSTAGEIHGTAISDHSLVAAALRFERTPILTAEAPVRSPEDSYDAGLAIAAQLERPSLRGVFVLADGLTVNGTALVKGLNDELRGRAVVTGGLAGDGTRFGRTWVMRNRTFRSGAVTAVGFYGDHVAIGHGSKGGWDKFGPERLVTKSRDNVLYELDGRPALHLYKEYLGERAVDLPASALLFPLAIRSRPDDDKVLVRTILSVSDADQSMTFAGDIPEGCYAQLMRANFDRLIQGAEDAATLTVPDRHAEASTPTLALAVSCVGRRIVLGERAEEETEAAVKFLPAGARQIGFYSYGEISPYAAGTCDLHNQTMTLTTITER